jgi:stress-induced morphogen
MNDSAMLSTTDLKNLLVQALPGATVEVSDLTGTSDHFQAVIVAPQFRGKSRIEQHQIVYGALGDRMKQEIHALALNTRAAD